MSRVVHDLLPGMIDVHCHVAAAVFPGDPTNGQEPGWPCMAGTQSGATLVIDGKPFRALDARSWDASRRIEDMDRDQVAVQVLSPMPELLSYWFDQRRAMLMCDHMNAFIAEMVARAPNRFIGLGMVPLQFPGIAATYLEQVVRKFGLRGVEIGSNVAGCLPGDRRHDPFFAAAAAMDLAVFVHALHPLATKSLDLPPWFTPTVGFPLDVAMASASIITSGVLERFPELRIGFSHGGGGLASIIGRVDRAWEMTKGFGGTLADRPSETASRLFYDSNIYDPAMLAQLAGSFAPNQVFLGTDYPYDVMQTDPLSYLERLNGSDALIASVKRGAALKFLGLQPANFTA